MEILTLCPIAAIRQVMGRASYAEFEFFCRSWWWALELIRRCGRRTLPRL